MQPFPGTVQATLPGGLEWQRELDYARDGIPVSPRHQQALQDIADELEVESPFAQHAYTRFSAE
jgi:LDH2 family malate/lactate/ureidoglycolate dehydrogenase